MWRRIIPTATDWELRVSQIPDAAVEPLVGALLRGGNAACAPMYSDGCTPAAIGFAEPAAGATFDDPCLRRQLVLWGVTSIDRDQEEALAPALVAVAGSAGFDNEVVGAVVAAAKDADEDARMTLIRAAAKAGHVDAIRDELGGLSEESLTELATKFHIDDAVDALDADHSRAVFVGAITDPALKPETRLNAIADLAVVAAADKHLAKDIDKALTAATRDADCQVAAAAATTLVSLGKPHALPARTRSKKPVDAMRTLCVMAAADLPDAAADFVGPRGLKVVERSYDPDLEFAPDDNLDGDNDPRTETKVETVVRRDFEDIPFDTEIPAAMKHCAGTTCSVGAGVELSFGFVPAKDGGLWLDTIERHDRGDCGGNLPQK